MGRQKPLFRCNKHGECFARSGDMCTALTDPYPEGVPCPFQKRIRTNLVVQCEEKKPKKPIRDLADWRGFYIASSSRQG